VNFPPLQSHPRLTALFPTSRWSYPSTLHTHTCDTIINWQKTTLAYWKYFWSDTIMCWYSTTKPTKNNSILVLCSTFPCVAQQRRGYRFRCSLLCWPMHGRIGTSAVFYISSNILIKFKRLTVTTQYKFNNIDFFFFFCSSNRSVVQLGIF
jgi:hypothetical protein